MRKIVSFLLVLTVLVVFFWGIDLFYSKMQLRTQLIRFHVVANSDTQQDQFEKNLVRDAVLADLRMNMVGISDADSAMLYLQNNVEEIENLANYTLNQAGSQQKATVTVCRESFPIRVYETFTLPSGIYETLRITIGEGNGHNWWCVAFPDLCIPATSCEFNVAAVDAGFTEELSEVLSEPDHYKVRFFMLDAIGKVEKILFMSK